MGLFDNGQYKSTNTGSMSKLQTCRTALSGRVMLHITPASGCHEAGEDQQSFKSPESLHHRLHCYIDLAPLPLHKRALSHTIIEIDRIDLLNEGLLAHS